ncbi:CYTH domain-containing protein [Salipiger mangrovisoli]|uniref:CYTH domain-containing protein n=1 Tax=Salipiger mangrovisoli TaxID=2865933 RepID=A0ABR9X771_9RHOB|nr:CYTH domain-containing protein [Salipiger mangrovisoli]MBE9639448.1 CYTH domain-containing protein [Salipiger mangrovisoli]
MSGGVEIERKFLVAQLPDLSGLAAKPVRQGYVTQAGDTVELRLREKGGACFLTLKSDGGLARMEREIEITRDQFEALWPATGGRVLEKTRHLGTLSDGTAFELDVFTGALAPLVMVEVEFDTEDAARAFTPPAWFGADVTEDRRYRNRALADDGVPG